MSNITSLKRVIFSGLSSEDKPTISGDTLAIFIETDTQVVFYNISGAGWSDIKSAE